MPEFTVKQVDRSYDYTVPSSTYTDPYTGKQEVYPSYVAHVTNHTIEIAIRNQPFTSTITTDGNTTQLYYYYRVKGHFEDWSEASQQLGDYETEKRVPQSNSAYTVIVVAQGEHGWNYPEGSQIDYQVNAVEGFRYLVYNGHIFPVGGTFSVVSQSGWSNTQTLTIGNAVSAPATAQPNNMLPDPTATAMPTSDATEANPQQPIQGDTLFGFDWVAVAAVLAVAVVVLAVAVVALVAKRSKI
jgi:hypothetical protein